MKNKSWVAILWFAAWGVFQAFAVFSVLTGHWQRPEAFPERAYNALIYPDMFFIPLYLLTSFLLVRRHALGYPLGLIAGGAVIYVMIYLFALSGFKGVLNLSFDAAFLLINALALWQLTQQNRNLYPSQS